MKNGEKENMDIEDDTTSDEEDDDDAEEQQLLKRAEELEGDLSNQKYLYDAHLEVVDIYRKLGDLNSMRAAYERFHEYFPLTSKIWLNWIKDEIKLATNKEQKEKIYLLFDKAVEDYLSVELWNEYAQYALTISDLNKTREVLERALTAAGLHATNGSLLWNSLRECEHACLYTKEQGTEAWKTAVQNLANIFRRQLSVPLLNMESTYQEWRDWLESLPENTIDPYPIERGYKEALKIWNVYKDFEDQILNAASDDELCKIYKEYALVVDKQENPSAVLCLFERAVEQLALNVDLWNAYCMYSLKLEEAGVKISGKALRNCPWSEELWITRLRIFEQVKKKPEEVVSVFDQGLSHIAPSPGVDLWLTYLEYTRRNTPEKLESLLEYASDQLQSTDPAYRVTRWMSRYLASHNKMKDARNGWKLILRKPENKNNIIVWLEYVNYERQYGEERRVREIYQRALAEAPDWCQYIAQEWLLFERECGSMDDVLNCTKKCQKILGHVHTYVDVQPQEKGKKRKHGDDSGYKKGQYVPETKKSRVDKEKLVEKPPAPVQRAERDPEKTVFVSNLHPSITEVNLKEVFPNALKIDLVHDHKGKSRCYAYVEFSIPEEAMTALARDREPLDGRPIFISNCKKDKTERKTVFKYAAAPEDHKLFVRGLPIAYTQEQVQEVFKPHGAVQVRLVVHRSGQNKGLAYVEFENAEAARKALKATDQMKLGEHVLTVAVSAPPPKGAAAGFASSEPIRHARSRLQVPMIPRSLQVKGNDAKGVSGASGSNLEAPKSNADFRKMLLKK